MYYVTMYRTMLSKIQIKKRTVFNFAPFCNESRGTQTKVSNIVCPLYNESHTCNLYVWTNDANKLSMFVARRRWCHSIKVNYIGKWILYGVSVYRKFSKKRPGKFQYFFQYWYFYIKKARAKRVKVVWVHLLYHEAVPKCTKV